MNYGVCLYILTYGLSPKILKLALEKNAPFGIEKDIDFSSTTSYFEFLIQMCSNEHIQVLVDFYDTFSKEEILIINSQLVINDEILLVNDKNGISALLQNKMSNNENVK